MLFEEKMESFSAEKICFLLACLIRFCVSDQPIDSESNLFVQKALSEFENRYESVLVELKSEITSCKSTEAKVVDEINELKHLRLQDVDEISQLKSELELTKREVGTLKLKMDKYETVNILRHNVTFEDTIKQLYPEKDQEVQIKRKTIVAHTSEHSIGDLLQTDIHDAFPSIGKENVAVKGSSQHMFDPKETGDTASVHYNSDRRRKARGITLHFVAYIIME